MPVPIWLMMHKIDIKKKFFFNMENMAGLTQKYILLLNDFSVVVPRGDRIELNRLIIELNKIQDDSIDMFVNDIVEFIETVDVNEEDEQFRQNIMSNLKFLETGVKNKVKRAVRENGKGKYKRDKVKLEARENENGKFRPRYKRDLKPKKTSSETSGVK